MIIPSLITTFWFWIPLIFIVIVAILFSNKFWRKQGKCPRCNAPISIYMSYCKNCGLKLINQFPSCKKYISSGLSLCDRCGFEFLTIANQPEVIEYEIITKDKSNQFKPNFCPYCGIKFSEQNFEYCESCGAKID